MSLTPFYLGRGCSASAMKACSLLSGPAQRYPCSVRERFPSRRPPSAYARSERQLLTMQFETRVLPRSPDRRPALASDTTTFAGT